jgi:hypothetical protein
MSLRALVNLGSWVVLPFWRDKSDAEFKGALQLVARFQYLVE